MPTNHMSIFYSVLLSIAFAACLNSCACSKSDRIYHDTPTSRDYFLEFGAVDSFISSDGNLTLITYGDLDCIYSDYREEYIECEYRRFEYCKQFGNVIEGEEALTNELTSNPFSNFTIKIDSFLLIPKIQNNLVNQGIYTTHPDTMTLLGVQYQDVYKYERTNSPDSAIRWVIFNLENRIIQVRMNNEIEWNRKP